MTEHPKDHVDYVLHQPEFFACSNLVLLPPDCGQRTVAWKSANLASLDISGSAIIAIYVPRETAIFFSRLGYDSSNYIWKNSRKKVTLVGV